MDTFKMAATICEQWRRLWPVDNPRLPASKQGVVCPLCGSGRGTHHSGVKEIPWKGKHRLKCFCCGFYGDAVNLLGREMGLKPKGRGFIAILEEGARRLAENQPPAGMVVPSSKKPPPRVVFTAFYEVARAGLEEEAARAYMKRRGLCVETARRCGCGYVARWRYPFGGKTESPRFILPCDAFNYLARDVRNDAPYPKVHVGGKTLFNPLHALESDGVVFVVEGAFDALAVIECGGAAVALMGTGSRALIDAATKTDFAGVFAIALDADEAGRSAAMELQKRLDGAGFSYGFSNLALEFKDAAEAYQNAPERFRALITNGGDAETP